MFNKNRKTAYSVYSILIVMLVMLIIFATAIGAVNVPFFQTAKIILKNLGLHNFKDIKPEYDSIIFLIRLPRVVVAIIVGSALSVSGAVMQSMFRNPMADPGIIGVSSGASLGAVIAITLNLTSKSMYFMPLLATIGALTACAIIFLISSRGGKIPVLTLILAGIAVSTFINSITSILLSKIAEYQVKEYLFWSVGSLSGRRWEHVKLAIVPIIICVILLIFYSRDLNVMLLGEEEAQSVGINVYKTRRTIIFLTCILTSMAVCISGSISFVGLIVPHIMRMIVGPNNKRLIPVSALAGAIFLVGCDLIGRTVIMPSEIGVGIVTSMIGAPYFLYLLNKARKEGVAL